MFRLPGPGRARRPSLIRSVLGFVNNACANGQQMKRLIFADGLTRGSLAIGVAGSICFGRAIAVLSRLVTARRATRHLRSGNGTEFVSKALRRWAVAIARHHLDSPRQAVAGRHGGEPQRQISRKRLSMDWFRNRQEAKVGIELRRQHDNSIRPRSILGNMTPATCCHIAPDRHDPGATLKTGVVRRILVGSFELPPEPDLTVHARLGIAKENLMIFYPGNIHPANVTEVESLYLALDLVAASGSMVSLLC